MPAKSKAQQRLMGMAYAVKKGDTKLSDIDAEYRDKIKELVDGMSLEDLKDFAETKTKDLPNHVEETIHLNPGMNVPGMGDVSLPGNPGSADSFSTQTPGSGDIPFELTKKKKKKKKKLKYIKTFENFINGN